VDDPEDVHALIAGLHDVLRVYKKVRGQDADWIYDGVMQHLKSKPKTRIQNRNLGLFVALLIAQGASLNQIALAFKDWDGTSESTIKRGYYPVRDEFRLPKDERSLKNSKFVQEALFTVYLFENEIGKPFPRHKRYEDAYQGFHKAKAFSQKKIRDVIDLKIQMGLIVLEKEERKKAKA
jgi:hypothetical protein